MQEQRVFTGQREQHVFTVHMLKARSAPGVQYRCAGSVHMPESPCFLRCVLSRADANSYNGLVFITDCSLVSAMISISEREIPVSFIGVCEPCLY